MEFIHIKILIMLKIIKEKSGYYGLVMTVILNIIEEFML